MDAAYLKWFRTPVEFRIIERRTPLLDKILEQRNLNEVRSIACEPQPRCERKRCFVNVDQMVSLKGGELMTGWIFNEYRGRYIEGEPHAVWRSKGGKVMDVTPHEHQPKRLLFAPDKGVALKRGYTAGPKLMLTNDPHLNAIEQFDSIMDQLFEEKFDGFGKELGIYAEEIELAANEASLPVDVANYLVECRIKGYQ